MILSPGEFTFRYRVSELWFFAPEGDGGEETAAVAEPREFRTFAGAEKHRERLLAKGRKAVVQTGILRWMSMEDAKEEARRLQVEGGHFG